MAVILAVAGVLPAVAQPRTFGFIYPMWVEDSDGQIHLLPNSGDQIVGDVLLDQLTPDGEWASYYAQRARELAAEGMVTGFGAGEGLEVERTYITLPDHTAFRDYHFRALSALRDRLNAFPGGGTDHLFDDDLRELLAFVATFDEINEMMSEISLQFAVPGFVFDGARLEELLSRRHFAGSVQDIPRLEMRLEAQGTWRPEDGPLAVPFVDPDRAEHQALRRVRFTALNTGPATPSSVRLVVEADAPFRVLPGAATCGRVQTAGVAIVPVICESPYEANGVTLEIEISTPAFSAQDFQLYPQVRVRLSAIADSLEWQEVATADWGMRFRRCDAEYADRIGQLSGLIQTAYDTLFENAAPIEDLPGTRLYPGITATFIDFAPNVHTEDFLPVRDVNDVMTELVNGQLVDDELRTLSAEVDSALHDLGFLRSCQDETMDSLFERLDAVLDRLAERRTHIAILQRQSSASTLHYLTLAQRQLAEFDDDQIFSTPDKTEARLSAELAGATITGALSEVAVGAALGPRIMADFAARASIVGALAGTAQVLSAAYDLAVLELIEENVDEGIAWLEASAYFEGAGARYARYEKILANIVSRLREVRRETCICLDP